MEKWDLYTKYREKSGKRADLRRKDSKTVSTMLVKCMYGYELQRGNISFPNVQLATNISRLCGSALEVLF